MSAAGQQENSGDEARDSRLHTIEMGMCNVKRDPKFSTWCLTYEVGQRCCYLLKRDMYGKYYKVYTSPATFELMGQKRFKRFFRERKCRVDKEYWNVE